MILLAVQYDLLPIKQNCIELRAQQKTIRPQLNEINTIAEPVKHCQNISPKLHEINTIAEPVKHCQNIRPKLHEINTIAEPVQRWER